MNKCRKVKIKLAGAKWIESKLVFCIIQNEFLSIIHKSTGDFSLYWALPLISLKGPLSFKVLIFRISPSSDEHILPERGRNNVADEAET